MKRAFRHAAVIFFVIALCLPCNGSAATKTIKLSGKLTGGAGYRAFLISKSGATNVSEVRSNGTFKFAKVTSTDLSGASLQLVSPSGRYFGPVILKRKGTKASLNFSGKPTTGSQSIDLGKITLNTTLGFALVTKLPEAALVNKTTVKLAANGAPAGAGKMGLGGANAHSTNGLTASAEGNGNGGGGSSGAATAGVDGDGDGIPNVLDVDDDGDGVIDSSDPNSASTTAADIPFTTLYLSANQTLNVNVGTVTQAQIDAVIGGENLFSLIIFYDFAPGTTIPAGGHVVCPASLEYCRPTSVGGGTAVLSGVSESNRAVVGGLWTSYNADRSGYPNLEPINRGGERLFVAGIQPRVDTSKFRPGDVFQIEFSDSTGSVISTKTAVVPPYFVTIPAIAAFNGGAGTVTADYRSPTPFGTSTITVTGTGALQMTFWRPQRQALSGAEEGSYRDMGHLHYGLIFSGSSGEFGCSGFYSGLSSTLSEETGSSTATSLWPLTDSANDAAPDATNTLSFTVNVSGCVRAHGLSAGTYSASLTAAGESLQGGSNRAAQSFSLQVP